MYTRNSPAFLFFSVFVVSLCCSQLAYADSAPCDLLTQNQVSAIVGANVGAASPIANTGCSWKATAPAKALVSVSMQTEKMFAAAAKGPVPPNTTRTSISGVGDEAVFVGMQGFSSLWVRKGAKCLLVRLYGLSAGEAQPKLTALATAAVSKL